MVNNSIDFYNKIYWASRLVAQLKGSFIFLRFMRCMLMNSHVTWFLQCHKIGI